MSTYRIACTRLCREWVGMYVVFGTGFCSFPLASRPWNAIRLQDYLRAPGWEQGGARIGSDAMRRGRLVWHGSSQAGSARQGGLEDKAWKGWLWAPALGSGLRLSRLADWTEMGRGGGVWYGRPT